jgi:transcriptional regulator of arginine metabolism
MNFYSTKKTDELMKDITAEERQKLIKEIFSKQKITSQKQLVDILEKKFNIKSNQAVISRDLRKLKVVKTQKNNELIYEIPINDATVDILKLGILSIEHNEIMILINTHPGLAPFVGDYIDKRDDLNILGCIAGENVVFVTPKTIHNISKTYENICIKLYYKK